MTPEELDEIRYRVHSGSASQGPRTIVLDLRGDDDDHTLVRDGDVLRCSHCGAGRYVDRPGLLPAVCDRVGYRRRKMGL